MLLEIDLEGARQVLKAVPEAQVILIVPPTEAHQVERLRRRGDTEAHVPAQGRARAGPRSPPGRDVAHHVVVNDDLGPRRTELLSILGGLRDDRGRGEGREAP